MHHPDDALTEDELAAIEERAAAATPGPWHVRLLDDDHAANLVAVGTTPDTGRDSRWPKFAAGELVAATLVQFPHRYVDCADERWDENALFIAHAREDIPRLVAEIRRLRSGIGPTDAP
ncbi:hypothetical protein [Micromonospora auratinigra]|uniref:Uncharacterized protein n=1 Tax=Micromonospora auratinigra TaxID=261654 RepID=A0A1A8Z508_9ACTN|nr:hypothetical protein [Micromonospora auratinigra]SBT39021.1 hypothetical protein GA0070611_0757 [Micromonospora auratinigra]